MKATAIEPWGQSLLSIGLCALGLLVAARCVSAETIASVANPNLNFSGIMTSVDEANEVSWTSANTYNDVSVSASFGQVAYANASGTAYLMTQVGPGTTAAEQMAVASFTFPNSTGGAITLFQNLSLGPGSYYLVLYSTDPVGGGWLVSTSNPTLTTAAGVTIGGSGYFYDPGTLKGPFFPYAPSVPFTATQSNEQFVFDVEGQAAGVSSAPEPSSIGFLAAAGLLAGFVKVRASKRVRALVNVRERI